MNEDTEMINNTMMWWQYPAVNHSVTRSLCVLSQYLLCMKWIFWWMKTLKWSITQWCDDSTPLSITQSLGRCVYSVSTVYEMKCLMNEDTKWSMTQRCDDSTPLSINQSLGRCVYSVSTVCMKWIVWWMKTLKWSITQRCDDSTPLSINHSVTRSLCVLSQYCVWNEFSDEWRHWNDQ